jgi:glutamate-ammonia-ligase adenylyltransferase
MSFASDADLIFVSDNSSLSPDIQKTFIDFFTKLKQELLPVEIDCRLRPEGKSSQIIWDITTYKNYLDNRARTWEFQSLCRLRFLYGNESLFNDFTDAVEKKISKLEMNSLKKDILDMRKKIDAENISSIKNIFSIKKNKGGLVDIEFITQFLILCNPRCYNQCRGKDIFQIFSTINKHKKELSNDINILKENYSFLKTLELAVQNIFNTSTNILPMEAGKLDVVASEMGFNSNEFNSKLKEIIKLNSQLFQKILT